MAKSRVARIPAVIREQLEVLARERDQAVAQEAITREAYEDLQKIHNKTGEAVSVLRQQLEDMRRQRDRAEENLEIQRGRSEIARQNLARALGWIDGKMDRPPEIEPDFHNGRPF